MQAPILLKNKMLSTSLLPKTSTPIRARIISKEAVVNGTPINQLKLCVSPGKENIDLQNFGGRMGGDADGRMKNAQEEKVGSMISFAEFRFSQKHSVGSRVEVNEQIKLSPTLSLTKRPKNNTNKFLQSSASFTAHSFRSLTPNNLPNHLKSKKITTSKQKLPKHLYPTTSTTANLSIVTPFTHPFTQSSSSTNLRGSQIFSTLFQPRSKKSTRLGSMAFGQMSRKNKPSLGGIGEIDIEKIMRKNSHRYRGGNIGASTDEPNLQLVQGSFGSGSNSSFAVQSSSSSTKVMCINNHGKSVCFRLYQQAKYRIKSSQDEEGNGSEGQQLVYCSKCAIDMVQKGFLVEEINVASVTVPYNLRKSSSNKPSFLFFTNNNPSTKQQQLIIQRLKTAQHLKHSIKEKLADQKKRQQIIFKKVKQEMQAIDCYYDSMIFYVEQQRLKDRQKVEEVARRVWEAVEEIGERDEGEGERIGSTDQILKRYYEALEMVVRSRVVDSEALSIMNEVERHLQLMNEQTQHNTKSHIQQIISNPHNRLLTYPTTLQQQFDQFVSFLDAKGKLSYKPFDEPLPIPKTNALRFSFQKALQTQHRKKSFICDNNGVMNPLQEQEFEEDCDEKSFSQEHMKQTVGSRESLENCDQKQPFRTLFAEEDDILERDEDDNASKNDMYSPTFKAI